MKKLILVALFSLLFIPLFASASLDTNLYYGLQKNSDVKQLQEFLIDKGFLSGSSTGNFFSLTLNAVKAYQKSIKVSQSGYVGILTRTAINNDLATQLSASNAQSTAETGTTPPAPTPPATTNDVVATLQAQIALLTQQLQTMLAQQTTVQQIQQNTQQIVQNTTPTTCTTNWQCGSWSACTSSLQTRTCVDANSCGVLTNKPSVAQSCVVACTPNWQTGSWTTCTNNQQTRTVTDSNSCGATTGKPSDTQSCTPVCSPNWQCDPWNTCANNRQTRTCSDSSNCGILSGKPATSQTCCVPNWQCSGFANSTCVNGQQTQTCTDLNSCNTISGQPSLTQTCTNVTIGTDSGINIPAYSIAGSTDNKIFNIKISTDSTQNITITNSSLAITDTISNNSNNAPSFNNLTLWQGSNQIAGPVQMNVSGGSGTINFPLSSTLTVQNNTPLTLVVHGDVNPLGSSSIGLNSVHTFNVMGSSITTQNSQTTVITTGNATGSGITVLPYYAELSGSGGGTVPAGAAGYRNAHSLNVKIANVSIGADPTYPAIGNSTLKSFTLRFTGGGLTNNPGGSQPLTFIINLLDSGSNVLDTKNCTPVPVSGVGTCSITFSPNVPISAGGSVGYTLQAPNPIIQKQIQGYGGTQGEALLYLDDVDYSDGTTPDIHWNANHQPFQIFDYNYEP